MSMRKRYERIYIKFLVLVIWGEGGGVGSRERERRKV